MLLKLKGQASLDQKGKHILVLSAYDPSLADNLLAKGEEFWDSSFFFMDDPSKVQWALDNGLFDYLYAPLEKIGLLDKRFLKFL